MEIGNYPKNPEGFGMKLTLIITEDIEIYKEFYILTMA
jgi:hypothetical protein